MECMSDCMENYQWHNGYYLIEAKHKNNTRNCNFMLFEKERGKEEDGRQFVKYSCTMSYCSGVECVKNLR